MTRFFPALFFCVALLLPGLNPDTGGTSLPDGTPGTAILADDEECLYEVSWTLIKLGTIRVKTSRDLHAQAYIDSYEGLPFVDLHSVSSCVMDSSLYCRESLNLEHKEDQWWGIEYRSQSTAREVLIGETRQKDLHSPPTSRSLRDTLRLRDSHYIDGLAIGIFPRRFVHTRQTVVVPTILYGKLGSTTFDFTGKVVDEEIDALDRPVRAVEVTGYLDAEGIFGLTGDYTAWFSDDSLGVPIKAKVKVLVGSVTLELIKWNRKGWNPPQTPRN